MEDPLSKVAISKKSAPRLPAARKPRPTSFQPTTGGFSASYAASALSNFNGFSSNNSTSVSISPPSKEGDMNFHMPASEPRVGLNSEQTLPGEISRPVSTHASASVLTKIGDDEDADTTIGPEHQKAESKTIKAIANSNDIEVKMSKNNDSRHYTPTKTSIAASIASKSSPPSTKSHRRGTSSISYGADKFFSKILGNGTTSRTNRRHSMQPTFSPTHTTNTNTNPTTTTTTTTTTRIRGSFSSEKPDHQTPNNNERKRFSILSFYSSSPDSKDDDNFSKKGSIKSKRETRRRDSRMSYISRTSKTSIDDRKVLEPPPNVSLNQRQKRMTSVTSTMITSNGPAPMMKTGVDKEQSAARKVVDFFKRRSRMV